MSQPGANTSGSPWAYTAASQLRQSRVELPSPEDHHRELLNKAYRKALAALESAKVVIAGVASGLYDVESSQMDVSARLSGRPSMRYTGRKRKLSPSVYDYSDSGYAGAAGKADTPTQELLPASRCELRNHQLLAVRWLVSLELQGAGGVLADELEQDRRAEVAGLLSHLLVLPPSSALPSLSSVTAAATVSAGPLGLGGAGGGCEATAAAPASGGGGCGAQVCLLLAPGSSLGGWAEAISEHVDVFIHVYDGTASSAAALQAACAGPVTRGSGPHQQPPPQHPAPRTGLLGPMVQQPPPPTAVPSLSAGGCRGAPAGPSLQHPPGPLSSNSSSAAGVYPPNCHTQYSSSQSAAAASPLLRPAATASIQNKNIVVVLSPLEHLHRDAVLLTQIPQRLLVVDLAPCRAGGGAAAAAFDADCSGSGVAAAAPSSGGGGGSGSGGSNEQLFRPFSGSFGQGSEPGSGSGTGSAPRYDEHDPPAHLGLGLGLGLDGLEGRWRRQGMDLESYHNLHLLTRMPAACRVLLSAGVPEAAGDGIWLLLQLLAPKVQRPLWEAVSELQHGLVASGPVGAQCKDSALSELRGRLWGLLRPLTLHRRARDVDLTTMRAATTNLNLYDHFSAARADGA